MYHSLFSTGSCCASIAGAGGGAAGGAVAGRVGSVMVREPTVGNGVCTGIVEICVVSCGAPRELQKAEAIKTRKITSRTISRLRNGIDRPSEDDAVALYPPHDHNNIYCLYIK